MELNRALLLVCKYFSNENSLASTIYPVFNFVFQNLTREQADYCISHMKPYMDSKGRELPSAYDYIEFTRSLFVN